jgi:hypothetical protein
MEDSMTRSVVISALLLAATPAFAQSPAPSPTQAEATCLRQGYIYDFKPVPGNRSLVVIDLARKRYRLNFMGVCYNLQYHLGLGFKTHGVGSLSCVAKGDQVIMRDVVGPNWCVIKDIQAQTPELDKADAMAAADAKKH